MVFAEFQVESTGWNGKDFSGPKKPVPRLGSDGVLKLDSRLNRQSMFRKARERAKLIPGVIGFILYQGTSFSTAKPITNFIALCQSTTHE